LDAERLVADLQACDGGIKLSQPSEATSAGMWTTIKFTILTSGCKFLLGYSLYV